MLKLFLILLMGHAVADFGLQSQQMAKGKNRNFQDKKDYIPPGQIPQVIWPYYLAAHSLIHGFVVFFLIGSVPLAMFEAITHGAIDFGKCDNHYGVHEDQAMHMVVLLLIAYWRLH